MGHTATECPWLEEAEATSRPPKIDEKDEEPEVQFWVSKCSNYGASRSFGSLFGRTV